MNAHVVSPPADSTNDKLITQGISSVIEALGSGNENAVAELANISAAITASLIGGTTGANANRVLTAKGTTGRALQASVVSIDGSGNVTGIVNITMSGDLQCDDIVCDDVAADDIGAQDGAFSATLTRGGVSVAIVNQVASAPYLFPAPEDGTLKVIVKSTFAWTITETTTITDAGTATVTVNINGTPLGGTANSASTSEQSQAHISANAVAVGDDLSVTFASTSGDCENLSLNIAGTMVLA